MTIALPPTLPRSDEAAPLENALLVKPWPDAVIDAVGHDPRSPYVETFWLGILGPSTTWLLRRLAAGLDAFPQGFELDLAEAAASLGIAGRGGRHSPFMRALARTCRFGLAEARDDATLAVRRRLPPLARRQVVRLPPSLQEAHAEWLRVGIGAPVSAETRRRCRRLALSLLELGEDRAEVEQQLARWEFHPALAADSARWALEHRRQGGASGE